MAKKNPKVEHVDPAPIAKPEEGLRNWAAYFANPENRANLKKQTVSIIAVPGPVADALANLCNQAADELEELRNQAEGCL